ncbi:MAG: SDR family oxidoreductase [Hyphomicrobiales bacterium]
MELGRCLEGSVALVVGAGRGIGRATALYAAQSGAAIVATDIDQAGASATVEAIVGQGGRAVSVVADIRKPESMKSAADEAANRFGKLDVILVCAGIYPAMALADVTAEHFETVIGVNLKGVINCIQAGLPYLEKTGAGRIVIVSSITGNRAGYPGLGVYAASKGGVNGLIRTAALELAPKNITVNGVEPGTVRTEGVEVMGEEALRKIAQHIPLKRLATPAEIASACVFLASDAARYITGQTIIVDGGQTLPELPLTL